MSIRQIISGWEELRVAYLTESLHRCRGTVRYTGFRRGRFERFLVRTTDFLFEKGKRRGGEKEVEQMEQAGRFRDRKRADRQADGQTQTGDGCVDRRGEEGKAGGKKRNHTKP